MVEWVWIEQRRVVTLQPVSGRHPLAFEDAELRIDGGRGELRWSSGRIDALTRADLCGLPASERGALTSHLC